ncbi:MAG: DMT family transporter [Armatimonadetes bacterium]|nr:DMT family transporter [Armatimonadota bacterium]
MPTWRSWLPHPALVFVVLAWGLNFTVIKVAYSQMSPPAVGLVRYLFMFPLLLLWCAVVRQPLRYPPGRFWAWNFAGFVGSGVYMVLFLEGMRTAPAALGAIALATAPIMATVFSVFAKQERFTWRLLLGSLVAFGGVAVCILGQHRGSDGSMWGVLLVLASAVFWALSIVLYKPLLSEATPVRVLTLSFPGAMLVLIPYGWHSVAVTHWSLVSSKGWLAMVYLVLVAGVGAFAAYYKGLADCGPAKTSLTQYFVPPVAAIFATLVLAEKLVWQEVAGLVIVIAGVALAVWKRPSVTSERTSTDQAGPESPQTSCA